MGIVPDLLKIAQVVPIYKKVIETYQETIDLSHY